MLLPSVNSFFLLFVCVSLGAALLRATNNEGMTPLDLVPAGERFDEMRALLSDLGDDNDAMQSLPSSQRSVSGVEAIVKSLLAPDVPGDPELMRLLKLVRLVLVTCMTGETCA